MKEIIVRTANEAALQKLAELLRMFGFEVVQVAHPSALKEADQPDFMALAGIWKGRDITPESLRKQAWGDRV
jgi:hypothetical protein